jgi:hypothetical protein
MPEKSLAVFEGKRIRRHYDEDTGTWFFSVVDIVQVLIRQPDYQAARKYWNKLKERLKTEGSQLVTNCHQLKMRADDGKSRLTDAADPEVLLRLIQSVPSPKAEPIKLWLAKRIFQMLSEKSWFAVMAGKRKPRPQGKGSARYPVVTSGTSVLKSLEDSVVRNFRIIAGGRGGNTSLGYRGNSGRSRWLQAVALSASLESVPRGLS